MVGVIRQWFLMQWWVWSGKDIWCNDGCDQARIYVAMSSVIRHWYIMLLLVASCNIRIFWWWHHHMTCPNIELCVENRCGYAMYIVWYKLLEVFNSNILKSCTHIVHICGCLSLNVWSDHWITCPLLSLFDWYVYVLLYVYRYWHL